MMFGEEEKKTFPRPKPDTSPSKREETIRKYQEAIAPLREKRAKRTRAGGSWTLKDGKLVSNKIVPVEKTVVDEPVAADDEEKVDEPVEGVLPKEKPLEDAGE